MAIRKIRTQGDEILKKKSKIVEEIDDRILMLIEDLEDTMREYDGIGIAAPQIGVLRRVIVVCTDGENAIKLINPEIIHSEGEKQGFEGCLSVPEQYAEVKRPLNVVVRALNPQGEEIEIHGEDLMATALCHEIDHLEGTLITDKAIKVVNKDELKD